MTNSEFTNNSANTGGAIYLYNPEYMNLSSITVTNCSVFNETNNLDSTGAGGGLYYTCDLTYNCKLLMMGINNFTNNYADNTGGAIKWDMVEPNITSTIYY